MWSGKFPVVHGFAAFVGLLLTVNLLPAQSRQTADQRLWIRPFATYTYERTRDELDKRGSGVTLGVDVDGFHVLPRTLIGLDVRFAASHASFANQHTFGGGPRLSLDFGRFKPYGFAIISSGVETFNHPDNPNYLHDESMVYGAGGGFDERLTHYVSVRAEAEEERWRFSHASAAFYPFKASIGVSYQLHFRGRTGPRY